MSADELDIRHGGVVAVDTETLRGVMRRLRVLAADVGQACTRMESAMRGTGDGETWDSVGGPAIARDAGAAGDRSLVLAANLGHMADLYEYIELSARADFALRSSDAPAWAAYREEMQQLRKRAGAVALEAWAAKLQRGGTWNEDFAAQARGGGFEAHPLWGLGVGAGASSLTMGLGLWGRGTVGREERLTGPPPPVVVRAAPAASAAGRAAAPAGLAAAMSRIPQGAAQVRVETYTMANGSKQYAVYIAGTRAPSFGAKDPFDLTSNVQLYDGKRSASYEAVRQALHQSGAGRGDIVHAFGHSQGAMIGGRVALESEFEVKTLATAGPPIEADVSESTLSVALRHTDDPVAILSGGGTPEGPGSPDSFIAERLADPQVGMHDLDLGVAHGLDVYTETAQMVDDSTDPRVDSLRGVFAELDGAVSVEVTEYVAERPGPSAAGDAE